MNEPVRFEAPSPRPPLWRSLAALIRLALDDLCRATLPREHGLQRLLLAEASELLPGAVELRLNPLLASAQQEWPPTEGALASLVSDLALELPDALLLTLLGEVERSHAVALALAELQAPERQPRPTVHLCCALFDRLFGPGTLSPLTLPDSALARSGLLQLESDRPLPLKTLRLSAGYWSLLLEQLSVWPRCTLLDDGDPDMLPSAVAAQLPLIADLLRRPSETGMRPAARGLIVRGAPQSGRRIFAQLIARQLQRRALLIPMETWQEERALPVACACAGWLPVLQPNLGPGDVWRPPVLPEGVPLLLLLGTDGAVECPDLLEVSLPVPDETQRAALWMKSLAARTTAPHPTAAALTPVDSDLPSLAASLAASALLSGPAIATLGLNARLLARRCGNTVNADHVAQARRQLGAERLRLLAQPVHRDIDRGAIVLPPLVSQELERLLDRARRRETLWQNLGSTLRQTATGGLRVLFTGDSGTGKTLAASYVATRLGAPLYRVDLSAVMNKYIGESEKNLSALLDTAAAADVVLLFDEADSLFGRRTEGKETGERFANMLTHFLLTRIENHPGIVILTSNNRERIDDAFNRRLDLIIEFPQPGFEERLHLWRTHLGARGPGEETCRLVAGYCTFSGGQLRNVVLTAAACAGDGPITAEHMLAGLQAEYRKQGRDMPAKLQQIVRAEGER
jgi:hypothetical protein